MDEVNPEEEEEMMEAVMRAAEWSRRVMGQTRRGMGVVPSGEDVSDEEVENDEEVEEDVMIRQSKVLRRGKV